MGQIQDDDALRGVRAHVRLNPAIVAPPYNDGPRNQPKWNTTILLHPVHTGFSHALHGPAGGKAPAGPCPKNTHDLHLFDKVPCSCCLSFRIEVHIFHQPGVSWIVLAEVVIAVQLDVQIHNPRSMIVYQRHIRGPMLPLAGTVGQDVVDNSPLGQTGDCFRLRGCRLLARSFRGFRS
jgi:hypothetical protein